MKQDLLTLSVHIGSLLVVIGVRVNQSFVFYVVFGVSPVFLFIFLAMSLSVCFGLLANFVSFNLYMLYACLSVIKSLLSIEI